MTSTPAHVSSTRKPVISLMSRTSIFAEYTKPNFVSPLKLEGHGFAARRLLHPTVNHFKKPSAVYDARVPIGDGAVHLGIALAQLPDKRVNNAIWEWGKF